MKFVMEKEENVVKKVEDDEEEILGFGDWEIWSTIIVIEVVVT